VEIVAVSHIFQFNYPEHLLRDAGYPDPTVSFSPNIAPGVVMLIFIPIILLVNLLPVRQFGQMEYVFGSIKMLFVIVMILLNTILHSLHRVKDQKLFWTYNEPYGFISKNITMADGQTVITGGAGQLAGVWYAV
jgi:amino acid transporter